MTLFEYINYVRDRRAYVQYQDFLVGRLSNDNHLMLVRVENHMIVIDTALGREVRSKLVSSAKLG